MGLTVERLQRPKEAVTWRSTDRKGKSGGGAIRKGSS